MSSIPGPGGPVLPPPEDLKKYDAASPGLGRQIIEMVQEEQKHLQYVERSEISLRRRGQLFGFIIAISFLVVSGFLVSQNHDVAGTVIGSVDLVALTTVFVVGQRSLDKTIASGQVKSTDRLIRELRRADSKGTSSRKSKRGQQASALTEHAASASVPKSSPTSDNADKGQNAQVSVPKSNSMTPEPQESLSSAKADSLTVENDTITTSADLSNQPPNLTEEDIQLYREIYNDPLWRPDQGQSPPEQPAE